MTKKLSALAVAMTLLLTLSGCNRIGEKAASLTVVYIATTVLALLLAAGYCFLIKKKDPWFLLLFSSVFVVNVGYLTLAVSSTVEEALLANRVSYLGSVFLPLSMFMVIVNACKYKVKRWHIGVLLGISIVVFLIAASPGYLDIYYKSVTLTTVNGVTVLEKEYGPWHSLYLYYLVGYFAFMLIAIIFAVAKKKIDSAAHAAFVLAAVFVNIGVWLLEQLVKFDFEMLSVSYIVSELFLLGLYLLLQDSTLRITVQKQAPTEATLTEVCAADTAPTADVSTETLKSKCEFLESRLCTLTPTEKSVYNLYLEGKSTKDVLATLNIKENTLKYHNKNIYSKLGVTSRKELLQTSLALKNFRK